MKKIVFLATILLVHLVHLANAMYHSIPVRTPKDIFEKEKKYLPENSYNNLYMLNQALKMIKATQYFLRLAEPFEPDTLSYFAYLPTRNIPASSKIHSIEIVIDETTYEPRYLIIVQGLRPSPPQLPISEIEKEKEQRQVFVYTKKDLESLPKKLEKMQKLKHTVELKKAIPEFLKTFAQKFDTKEMRKRKIKARQEELLEKFEKPDIKERGKFLEKTGKPFTIHMPEKEPIKVPPHAKLLF